jgi:hypothetical protein
MAMLKSVNAAAKKDVPQTTGLVYRGEKDGNTIVGYWLNGVFVVLSRHSTRGAALNKINALNGGSGTVFDAKGNLFGAGAVVLAAARAA